MMKYEEIEKIVKRVKDNIHNCMCDDVSQKNLDNYLNDIFDVSCEDLYENELDVISDIVDYISHL